MQKMLIGFLSFLCLSFPLAAADAGEYEHSLAAEKMTVQWRLDETMIHLKLTAPTQGWVGIGFGPEDAMKGADFILGAVKKGKVKIVDHYGDKKRGHSSDEKLGGKNHVQNPQGSEVDGTTSIWFSLPLGSDEQWDKSIEVNSMYPIMLAYGSGADSFRRGHAWRGSYEVNFTSGESKKVK
ncbi:MAG: DOMON domain-containing protein [Desulfobacterales bacterium]|nr:DOMON domain-containing protein [Desulfobacterales bacterium]